MQAFTSLLVVLLVAHASASSFSPSANLQLRGGSKAPVRSAEEQIVFFTCLDLYHH